MRINKGIIALTIAAVLMTGIVNASDDDKERLTLLMMRLSKATTENIKSAKENGMSIEDYMRARAGNEADSLISMAKNSPFDVNAITDAAIRLKTIGLDLYGHLQPLVDGVAHFGGNSNGLHQAAFAIQQMVTKKRVSMEEISRLDEVMPNASQLMARGMGVSMEDLIKKVSKGIVNSKPATLLMMREMEVDYAGSGAEEMMMKSSK